MKGKKFSPSRHISNFIQFPPVDQATPEGIVAAGGNLEPNTILSAYLQGIFPWFSKKDPILWWSPNPRAIIPLDKFHISRSLQKTISKKIFTTTFNKAFKSVITQCADRRDDSTHGWIISDMINAYTTLHHLGFAHSLEVWMDDRIVGGLYGVAIAGLFAGESMFYRETNASKVGLVTLVEHLRNRGFTLLDCQMVTPATKGMGAKEISRESYLALLKGALQKDCTFI